MQKQMAEQGLRVIALAYRDLPPHTAQTESELIFTGLIAWSTRRARASPRHKHLPCRGIRVIMITGDHPKPRVRWRAKSACGTTPSP